MWYTSSLQTDFKTSVAPITFSYSYMSFAVSWRDNHTSTTSLNFYRPSALPAAQPTVSEHWRQSEPYSLSAENISTNEWRNCYLLKTPLSFEGGNFFNFCVWAVTRAKIVWTVCQVFLWSVPGQDAVCTDNITIECWHVVLGRTLWSLVSHQQFPPWVNCSFRQEFWFLLIFECILSRQQFLSVILSILIKHLVEHPIREKIASSFTQNFSSGRCNQLGVTPKKTIKRNKPGVCVLGYVTFCQNGDVVLYSEVANWSYVNMQSAISCFLFIIDNWTDMLFAAICRLLKRSLSTCTERRTSDGRRMLTCLLVSAVYEAFNCHWKLLLLAHWVTLSFAETKMSDFSLTPKVWSET